MLPKQPALATSVQVGVEEAERKTPLEFISLRSHRFYVIADVGRRFHKGGAAQTTTAARAEVRRFQLEFNCGEGGSCQSNFGVDVNGRLRRFRDPEP
jgi:hypothetical protein